MLVEGKNEKKRDLEKTIGNISYLEDTWLNKMHPLEVSWYGM